MTAQKPAQSKDSREPSSGINTSTGKAQSHAQPTQRLDQVSEEEIVEALNVAADALEKIAAHKPGTPGLQYPSLDLLIDSATAIAALAAEDVRAVLALLPSARENCVGLPVANETPRSSMSSEEDAMEAMAAEGGFLPRFRRTVVNGLAASPPAEEWGEIEHLQIGTPVRVSDTYRFRSDWLTWTGFVVGIHADTRTGRIAYDVNDHWPPKHGDTDGFYGEDLAVIAPPSASKDGGK